MKKRILTNWTFTRGLYLLMGVVIIIQSVISQQLLGFAMGSYFAAMGLFAFGCASGSCFSGNCSVEPKQKPNAGVQDIEFEEIKTK